ncbi:hypothetical protein [Sulfurimonas paralvinellae]|uniref:Uncharacterized protein n=1 Tax=Sulfurimonas paralvinellae TaxID=317658 RepID=A0A7M1BAW2_9BACT|nr:hypothetical protein [Sulfurimonas paralvinellae]QOP45968.1 hypothetical protein FM071_06545 [Sulfurimonas paralvinellae]
MNNDYINLIEPTPKLHSKKCKVIAFFLRVLLQYSIYPVALLLWYYYDYFIAGASLLLLFIVVGIIRAKLRNSVIPLTQREYHYSDAAIADWYSAKVLCTEEDES